MDSQLEVTATAPRPRSRRRGRPAPSPERKRRWLLLPILAGMLALAWLLDWSQKLSRSLQSLHVVAISADGAPMQGVRVSFFRKGATHQPASHQAVTGADGVAELPAASADGEFFCVGQAPTGTVSQTYVLQEDAPRPARLEFGAAEKIRGYVFAPNGLPVAGARIEAIFAGGPSLETVETGRDGHFVLEKVSHTLPFLTVQVSHDGYAAAAREWDRQAGTELAFDLVPTPPLRVRIVLPDGSPVANARVRVLLRPELERITDPHGVVEWRGLDPETAIFPQVDHPTFTYRNDGFMPEEYEQVLKLEPPAFLVGQILALDGAPVAGAEVRHSHGPRAWVRAQTDGKGLFRIGDLPGGSSELIFELPSGETGLTTVTLRSGETLTGYLIRLKT